MDSTFVGRAIKAPTGSELSCRGWHQEAALRMLMNNLDPAVAENPSELIVYGGAGKAARNWECYRKIVATLKRLENDETLLVQSGKPVGVFRTHEEAPRVLIANAHLVPKWATFDEFRRLEALGLTMFGQMTAGSWIYIGTQGILQGTYETLAAAARKHFGGVLEGRLLVTAGLGGMGGAQPLATTMNGGAFLGIEVDESRIRRRVETGYCDRVTGDLDEALDLLESLVDDFTRSARLVGILRDGRHSTPSLEFQHGPDVRLHRVQYRGLVALVVLFPLPCGFVEIHPGRDISKARRLVGSGRLRVFVLSVLLILLGIPAMPPLYAQSTRAEKIQAERRDKAATSQPERVSKTEGRLNAIKDKKLLERLAFGYHGLTVVLGGLGTGQGFALGPQYLRSDLGDGSPDPEFSPLCLRRGVSRGCGAVDATPG